MSDTASVGSAPGITHVGLWGRIANAMETWLSFRWANLFFQLANAIAIVVLVEIEHGEGKWWLALAVLVYAVVFLPWHYFMVETPRRLAARFEAAANERVKAFELASEDRTRNLATDNDMIFAAQRFLISRLRTLMRTMANLRGADGTLTVEKFNKLDLINDALKELCNNIAMVAGRRMHISMEEAWFRATYMEIQGTGAEERLVFLGWNTRDGNQPRSMVEGKSFRKGEGCAGLAWERNEVVIEDEFKPNHEWINVYTDQGKNYRSMISVPVRKGYGDLSGGVIGVITMDTQIDKYFGHKDDRPQQDRAFSMIEPFGTYIALLEGAERVFTGLKVGD